eukprot:14867553-Heterocapsa_arctica.AAC.1
MNRYNISRRSDRRSLQMIESTPPPANQSHVMESTTSQISRQRNCLPALAVLPVLGQRIPGLVCEGRATLAAGLCQEVGVLRLGNPLQALSLRPCVLSLDAPHQVDKTLLAIQVELVGPRVGVEEVLEVDGDRTQLHIAASVTEDIAHLELVGDVDMARRRDAVAGDVFDCDGPGLMEVDVEATMGLLLILPIVGETGNHPVDPVPNGGHSPGAEEAEELL